MAKDFEVGRIRGSLWLRLPNDYCERNDVREGDGLELADISPNAKVTTFDHLTKKETMEMFLRGEVPFRDMRGISMRGH
jgi:hypothetical protein